ncbi:MAG TPA: hypothetical protein VEF04_22160, partial [Blastocatellia bacterium]|nr:hypothetical protein [Blastocatellia bacterium]
ELDLTTGELDTFDLKFEEFDGLDCIWTAYNGDGSKLIYARNKRGVLGIGYSDLRSKVAIHDFATGTSEPIYIVPDTMYPIWVVLFPEFVPHTNGISFTASGASSEPAGLLGDYKYYIMKSLP